MIGSHFPINHGCNQENPDIDRAVARDMFPLYTQCRGESHSSGLISSVLEGEPYRIRGLIVHGASLLTSWPQTQIWRETLSKLEFLVCIDRQMTADAAYADIVLPATTGFEIDSYMAYGPIFRLREKLIPPVGDARNDYLIMTELAERLGYGHLYPQSEEAMIRFALEGSGFTLEDIKRAGGWVKISTPMPEYKKWEKGTLRPDGKPGFNTPTGKFEIWSAILHDYGYEPLPKYSEPTEGPLASPRLAQKYPLVFNSGARPQTDFRSQHHGIAGLVRHNPEPTVEINVEDAEARSIESGDLVHVRSPRGLVPFRACVSDNIIKGAVECSQGGGTPIGPRAWQEWNVNELTDLRNFDEISGFPVYKALLCDITKVEDATEATRRQVLQDANTQQQLFALPSSVQAPARLIYLDNAATTRVAHTVREAMLPYLEASLGNPSSIHGIGRRAREAVENARRKLAKLINTRPRRIIFTSGGSESINLALKGVAWAHRKRGRHIITSTIEHPAVLATCEFLTRTGFEITHIKVNADGRIDPNDLRKSIRDDTILVSIMLANNEVGTIQPVRELCAVAHEHEAIFHTDAVQAVGKIVVDVEDLGIDLLSLSGHKFHGPKGVGALVITKGSALEPLIHGGKQESGRRAGTENVPAIVGIGKAAELALHDLPNSGKMARLRDRLEAGVRRLIPEAKVNGHPKHRLPSTLNMTLPGLRGESLMVALDRRGVSLSAGSACKSGSPEPTHVLIAMGKAAEEAHCSVRFSLSHTTTEEEIDAAIAALGQVLEEMETTLRFLPCK